MLLVEVTVTLLVLLELKFKMLIDLVESVIVNFQLIYPQFTLLLLLL